MEQIDELIVEKLQTKDKKILRELFNNARTPISQIARKVRLSKESVNYRIKRLLETGLLTGFNTVIDVKKIGWQTFFAYIRLKNVDIEEEKSIIDYLKNHPNIAWLIKCIGNYDLILKVFAKDIIEFDNVLKSIESQFRNNIDECTKDVLIEENAVPFSFLYDKSEKFVFPKEKQIFKDKFQVDKTDLKILQQLANNARIQITDIASSVRKSRDLVKYRLKRLEQNKIIKKYRPDVWPKKLGDSWYFVILKLEKLSEEFSNKLNGFLFGHPNVTYFYKTVGSSDYQIELRVKSSIELNKILMELRSLLKRVLKRQELLVILFEYKYTYFPNALLDIIRKT